MNISDHEATTEIMNGNSNAFSIIVERYKDKGMTLAYRMLNNREDAEEALQDAFLRAYKALPKFEWKSSFSTWFYRILYNVCLSKLSRRKQDSHKNIQELNENEVIQENTFFNPEATFESDAFKQMIQNEMEKLDIQYSTILTLFYIQELSYNEIIDVTGLPLGTIKNRLFRARSILKESLLKHYQDSVEK